MNCSIILGNCQEKIYDIPKKSFDIVITSPPYNLGKGHHTGNKRHNPYDDSIPEKQYQIEQAQLLHRIGDRLNEKGSIFYNHKNRIKDGEMITPYQWILNADLIVKQELVWENGSQNFDKCRFYPMTERVYWLAKTPHTLFRNNINHKDLFTRAEWKPVGTNGKHTRAFPEQMVRDILSCFPTGLTVFDPYMGSGTVGVVCREMGFDFIGIEINPEYFNLARERILA